MVITKWKELTNLPVIISNNYCLFCKFVFDVQNSSGKYYSVSMMFRYFFYAVANNLPIIISNRYCLFCKFVFGVQNLIGKYICCFYDV